MPLAISLRELAAGHHVSLREAALYLAISLRELAAGQLVSLREAALYLAISLRELAAGHHVSLREAVLYMVRPEGFEPGRVAPRHPGSGTSVFFKLVRPEGFEPPTPRFEAWYSIQLSYRRARAYCPSFRVVWQSPVAVLCQLLLISAFAQCASRHLHQNRDAVNSVHASFITRTGHFICQAPFTVTAFWTSPQ